VFGQSLVKEAQKDEKIVASRGDAVGHRHRHLQQGVSRSHF